MTLRPRLRAHAHARAHPRECAGGGRRGGCLAQRGRAAWWVEAGSPEADARQVQPRVHVAGRRRCQGPRTAAPRLGRPCVKAGETGLPQLRPALCSVTTVFGDRGCMACPSERGRQSQHIPLGTALVPGWLCSWGAGCAPDRVPPQTPPLLPPPRSFPPFPSLPP